jgi:hypothetical protein
MATYMGEIETAPSAENGEPMAATDEKPMPLTAAPRESKSNSHSGP